MLEKKVFNLFIKIILVGEFSLAVFFLSFFYFLLTFIRFVKLNAYKLLCKGNKSPSKSDSVLYL